MRQDYYNEVKDISPECPEVLHYIPSALALTGRVSSWLKNPENRLPVSCTVLTVEDSMEGMNGIEYSWLYTSHGLRNGAGVALDLNNIRAKGLDNGKGLVASGVCSFMRIYNVLNEILRRGGTYKNGAITCYIDYDHPDIEEFLDLKPSDIPWLKRAVYVDEGLRHYPIKKKLAKKVNQGLVWLAKKTYDKNNNPLKSNVCLEVLLRSRATCLLSHVNLGRCTIEDLTIQIKESMSYLCQLHEHTTVENTKYYLPQSKDRQVGLGLIGLASMLAKYQVSYREFVTALESIELLTSGFRRDLFSSLAEGNTINNEPLTTAAKIAMELVRGYMYASVVAREFKMERAFTIAPTASCFTRHSDSEGYSVTPEISPPISREIERTSETFGIIEYDFHPDVEIASDVGWNVQWRLLNVIQRLMNSTGLAHSISANIWNSKVVDEDFIDEFLDSDLLTTYYRLDITGNIIQNKSQVLTADNLEKLSKQYDEKDDGDESLIVKAVDQAPGYCSVCAGE